jgi:hypothetical protein
LSCPSTHTSPSSIDGGQRIALVAQHALDLPLDLVELGLVEAALQLHLVERVEQGEPELALERIRALDGDALDAYGLALVDVYLQLDAVDLGARAVERGLRLRAGIEDARAVEAACAIPALDACQVALEHARIVERPVAPGPAPQLEVNAPRVERRLTAGRRGLLAQVDREPVALARRETCAQRERIELVDALQLQLVDPVAALRDRGAGRHGRSRHGDQRHEPRTEHCSGFSRPLRNCRAARRPRRPARAGFRGP